MGEWAFRVEVQVAEAKVLICDLLGKLSGLVHEDVILPKITNDFDADPSEAISQSKKWQAYFKALKPTGKSRRATSKAVGYVSLLISADHPCPNGSLVCTHRQPMGLNSLTHPKSKAESSADRQSIKPLAASVSTKLLSWCSLGCVGFLSF